MLLYPERIEDKLEITQVREIIKSYCFGEAAKSRVDKVKPLDKFDQLELYLKQTAEMLRVLNSEVDLPPKDFEDIKPYLKSIKTKGTFLEARDFMVLRSVVNTIYGWTQFFKKRQSDYPSLCALTINFIADKELMVEIEDKVDDRGEVRDNATPELGKIRKEIISAEKKVRKVIQDVLEKSKKEDFTDEDSSVTIRDGRLVIPVKAEFKRKLSGFVHDESSTGQTVFMEPTEALDLNNEVRELRYAEKREIIKILTNLSDLVRERMVDLEKGADFITKIDFIQAKAQFGKAYDALVPKVFPKPKLNLLNAVHPLLWQKHQEKGQKVEPLTISFDPQDRRIIVISGPNAGGKSVALKTVGLLQYMLQCGFPIPVGEESEVGIFRNIFIDIGDAQSLESDLSTYSSHLTAMKYFTQFANKQTLVLIDEFGTGTEPQFGGAIAQAILESLNKSRCYGVITTHYTNIKDFAEQTNGISNAMMKYDLEKLEPLYQMEMGKPGSSFALEIAEKIGLPKATLEVAKETIGIDQVNYDKVLVDLEREKSKLAKQNKSISREKEELADLRKDYEALKALIEKDKSKILREAKGEAKRIVDSANREIERTIREIKESQADKEKTKELREQVAVMQGSLEKELKPKKEHGKRVSSNQPKKIEIGDKVRVEGQEGIAEVLALKAKQAQVGFGQLTSFVDLIRLEKVSNREAKKESKKKFGGLNVNDKMASFSSELDVRGKRAEEVIPLVDKFLDEGLLLGTKELRILHGKGYGILKDVIRTHLRDDPNVMTISDEHVERGGDGISIIQLRN